MNRKYVLKLTADERGWLEGIVRTGKSAAWKIRHANAFLKMDRGEQGPAWEDARIAEAFGMSTRSLENWRKQAVEEGPREVLERYYPTRPQCRKLDGQAEAQLVKLACSQAPGERRSVDVCRTAGGMACRIGNSSQDRAMHKPIGSRWYATT